MPNTIRILIIGVTLLGTASPAVAQSINDKIVQYCKENVGAKVGDGQCSALAHVAFTQAGAKLEFKDQPNKGDYVWGKLVYTLEVVDNVQKKTTVPKMKISRGTSFSFGTRSSSARTTRLAMVITRRLSSPSRRTALSRCSSKTTTTKSSSWRTPID